MNYVNKLISNLILKLRGKKLRIEHSILWQEEQARKVLEPQMKEHIAYIDRLYDLCFACTNSLHNKTPQQLGEQLVAQGMILMQLTDFLRRIRADVIDGYPDQAATLASTVFELAHTAEYFSYAPEAAKKWLAKDSPKEKMPKLIGIDNYSALVDSNYKRKGMQQFSKNEYLVYTQLCLIKHSHPSMHGLKLIDNSRCRFQFGPYTDEKSINHAWFSMQHAGRLTEIVLESTKIPQQYAILQNELINLSQIRESLVKKATARYGTVNPF